MTDEQVEPRRGFEAGHWVNYQPTSEEVAAWFRESFVIDPALRHEDYVGGLVLIPTVSKAKYVTGFSAKGLPIIEEAEQLTYNPYPRVETRLNYFWSLLAAHPEWLAVVEAVELPRIPIDFVSTEEEEAETLDADGQPIKGRIHRTLRTPGAMTAMVYQLPTGFSVLTVPVGQGYTTFLCATTRISIYDREQVEKRSGDTIAKKLQGVVPLRTGRGTKQCPLLVGRNTPYADPSVVMRCETGSFGRALGFCGVFVISGAGLATAEDVLEAQGHTPTPPETAPGNQGPPAPPDAPVRTGAEQAQVDEAELSKRAVALWKALSTEHPAKAEEFGAWAKQRKIASLSAAQGPALRGVIRKLERLTDEASQEASREPAATPADAEPGGSPDPGA